MSRTHFIFVPGFGGFDALGSIHYYAGIGGFFEPFAAKHDTSLHYFDNLPTAAVMTRAKALRLYLRTRVEHREFRNDDPLVLVGHSTGGLDIRQLIDLLAGSVDGEAADPELLARITRVVFLSVPQQGTNLADFVHANPELVGGSAHVLGALMEIAIPLEPLEKLAHNVGMHAPGIVRLARELVEGGAQTTGNRLRAMFLPEFPAKSPDIVEAAHDAIREVADRTSPDPWIAAQSRQIHSDIQLWLENMADDGLAISDLSSTNYGEDGKSRLADLAASEAKLPAAWDAIDVLSYATIGKRPFDAEHFKSSDGLRSYLSIARLLRHASPDTDIAYCLCYAACSSGPFRMTRPVSLRWVRRPAWANAPEHELDASENDGIVNTASMMWPKGEVRLVAGDHGDIIGHFELRPRDAKHNDEAPARLFEGYDLLGSNSGFTQADLKLVWDGVFEFGLRGVQALGARGTAA